MSTAPSIIGTTNEERAFQPGDVIEYAGDLFRVHSNEGDGGEVTEHPDGEERYWFEWAYCGWGFGPCRLHTPADQEAS